MSTKICKNCSKEFSTSVVILGKRRDLRCRSRCLDCDPYKAYFFKKRAPLEVGYKQCVRCLKNVSLTKFTKKTSYCDDCLLKNKRTSQIFKDHCLNYKGGKCENCGYNKCPAALEFHHQDTTKKEFQLSRCKTKILTDSIKKELDKCSLLCSNCHREEHYLR